MTGTPQDTFLSDQAHATARDIATQGTPVAVFDQVSDGVCTWCECDITSQRNHEEFCAGCPNQADILMRIYHPGGAAATDIRLCTGHKPDALRFVQAIVEAGGFR